MILSEQIVHLLSMVIVTIAVSGLVAYLGGALLRLARSLIEGL